MDPAKTRLLFPPISHQGLVLAPAREPGAVWSSPRRRVLLESLGPGKGEEVWASEDSCARAATPRAEEVGVSHTWGRRQLPHNESAALATAGQMVSLPLESLWVSRSFCQERTMCWGVEEGPPEVPTSQWEEFSSKTKARGHSLVASGLFQCSGLWGFGPCSGDFWFVLS